MPIRLKNKYSLPVFLACTTHVVLYIVIIDTTIFAHVIFTSNTHTFPVEDEVESIAASHATVLVERFSLR
jgi:hypothetical protein